MGLLADIYSGSDSLKRKVKGLLADPLGTIEQKIAQFGEDQQAAINNAQDATGFGGNRSVLMSPQQKQQASKALGDYAGSMGLAGMFVGKGSSTWNKAEADKALKMAQSGADPRKIWSETGNWKGPDGMWRQEIPDNAARVTAGNVSADQMRKVNGGNWIKEQDFLREHYKTPEAKAIRTRASMRNGRVINDDTPKLFDTMEHGLLSDAYPELDQIRMAIDDKMPMGNGAFADDSKAIILSPMRDEEALGVQLHEVQHAIQQREGWAKGGSPEDFGQQKEAELARDALSWKRELLSVKKTMPSADAIALENEAVKRYQLIDAMDMVPSRQARDMAMQPDVLYADKYPGGQGDSLQELVNLYGLDKRTTPAKDFDLYNRLAGEAEARATQARIPLDASARRALFPEDSYDVPMNSLIIRGLLAK